MPADCSADRVAIDALQKWHAEPEGLSSAGLGLADQILSVQGERDAHLLDREG